jgi:hypothetical protein
MWGRENVASVEIRRHVRRRHLTDDHGTICDEVVVQNLDSLVVLRAVSYEKQSRPRPSCRHICECSRQNRHAMPGSKATHKADHFGVIEAKLASNVVAAATRETPGVDAVRIHEDAIWVNAPANEFGA